ncbi:PEP-CTERM putative exosortase interaction domain-containing protein [Leptolyngbya sp. PCC 7375]|nr:PEP-CTERM putative exosortase interaction domain-containing protein [Leptolyngbya sp. PCC 7375]
MIYKAFALGTFATLASVAPGNIALANDFDDDALLIFGETTIGDITAKTTQGINPGDSAGKLGAFSDFYDDNTTTIDFNSAATQVGDNSYSFGSDLITYTFESSISTTSGDRTGIYNSGIYNDRWAPTGANGEKNVSDYLAVFQGNSVTIDLAKELNYFGMNWGSLSEGNQLSFFNNGTKISAFTASDIDPILPIKAGHQLNQGNGYVHFYTNTTGSTFNQIVISQTQLSGFETDNHSFRVSNNVTDIDNPPTPETVPESSTLVGLAVVGAFILRCRFSRA